MKPTETNKDCTATSDKENMQEQPKVESGAATSTSVDESDSLAEANKLVCSGNKHMVLGDYPSAVNVFQEACQLLGTKYGETSDKCAEAYFLYGKALLELARMENGVLGNALEGVDMEDEADSSTPAENAQAESTDDLDDEKIEELREQVYDAMCERESGNGLPVEGKTSEAVENGDVAMEVSKADDHAEAGRLATGSSVEEKTLDVESATDVSGQAVASDHSKAVDLEEKASDQAPALEGKSEEAMTEDEKVSATKSEDAEGKSEVSSSVPEDQEMKEEIVSLPPTGVETATDKVEVAEKEMDSEHTKAEVQKASDAADGEKTHSDQLMDDTQVEAVEAKTHSGQLIDETKVETKLSKPEVLDGQVAAEEAKESGPEPMDGKTKTTGGQPETEKVDGGKGEENGEPMEQGEDDEDEEGAEEGAAEEGAAEDKENEEEVGNLQLAWEMLDLAQVIYKRNASKESQLCAAQAHLKLGEIGIESGNYTQAIGDYLECLKIQQQHLDACNRLLAESSYQLGLAYNYNNQYKEAVEHFTKSLDIIEKRLAMVSARVEKEGSEDDKTEIEDLKGLLPDIKEKIEDAKECMKSGPAAELALKQTLGSDSTSFPQQNGSSSAQASTISVRKAPEGTTSKPAADISHLRKPEEVSPQKNSDAKKPKQEATVNGSGDAVHNGNGVAKTEKLADKADSEMTEITS
ncbi:nuclear autoantigenic sperm protein isoform X3 [Protopterus annectens]|uniref:nuclear autoantigenic sperm protein isoform X3 n=1 Tax=Protopterus annectens TaxID=7888 RepID=UPI001CFBD0B7|nr:nuclear autoantigenic sperm protein isoform X3 [Protopterus annectens]